MNPFFAEGIKATVEDWLGKQQQLRRLPKPAIAYAVTIGVAATKLTGSSPERRSLRISTSVANIFLSDSPAVAAGTGLAIISGQHTEELCACHQGDFVTRALYAIAIGAPALVYVIEGFEER